MRTGRISSTGCLLILTLCSVASRCSGRRRSHPSSSALLEATSRHIRSLEFPEASGMGIFFALAVPVDIPDRSVAVSFYFEANYGVPLINTTLFDDYANQTTTSTSTSSTSTTEASSSNRAVRSLDRRLTYDIIENKFESLGYPGRACLLRAICESSEFPYEHNGLLGDVIRIIFTPSTSEPEDLDPELVEAERAVDCYEDQCPVSLLEVISRRLENN